MLRADNPESIADVKKQIVQQYQGNSCEANSDSISSSAKENSSSLVVFEEAEEEEVEPNNNSSSAVN